MAIIGFDPAVLLNYYYTRLPLGGAQSLPQQGAASAELPPWDLRNPVPPKEKTDVEVRSKNSYFDSDDASLLAGSRNAAANAGSQIEAIVAKALSRGAPQQDGLTADNHKLFALYKALHRLAYIAKMANREGSVDGLRPGLDADFQNGLAQIRDFVGKAAFDNVTVMQGTKSASTESTAVISYAPYNYTGKGIVQHSGWSDPVANVSAADSFTVSITKGGATTDVVIDLANVAGPLSLDNINSYVNQQLAAAGFDSKFARVQTGGSVVDNTAVWGIRVKNAASETVSLSSAGASPAIYVAGNSGAPASQQGRVVKLGNLDGAPQSIFSAAIAPADGDKDENENAATASARAAAVDAGGNLYVIGDATGNFGSQLNQGTSDVYLTKYDSAGKVLWTRLLGSSGSAAGFALGLDPSGGVVIAGSVTGDLAPESIGGGTDSFAAKFDSAGNRKWLRQIAPLSNDSALGVAVDSGGNVYLAGQVGGVIASGQTNAGGNDAYLTKLDSAGALVYHRQFGTAAADKAAAVAITADGNPIVASVENGHAILTKFDAADDGAPALWQVDLGELGATGGIGGIAVSGDQVYLSGTTSNASLDAGGAASIANTSGGGSEAFVFNLADSGSGATPGFVSYVGTAASEQGGGIAIAGGALYLTGTTLGTFAGETRAQEGTHNMFVARLDGAGALEWTRQYGGLDGQSKGLAIAADSAGAGVLDALGLPRGTIDLYQSSAIATQTTARAGDYFTLKIDDRSGSREVKIALSSGETLRSLAVKINSALLFGGKATAFPKAGGQVLKIEVEKGVRVELVAGPADFDALAGLGLTPQILVNAANDESAESGAGTSVIGLGIAANLNLLTKSTAAHANVVLQAAMALVKQAHSQINTPAGANTTLPSGPVPAYLQARIANYQTALAWLGSSSANSTQA